MDVHVVWDLEEEPDGNVHHIQQHNLSMDEIEDVLLDPDSITTSRSSGFPIAFGHTSSGRYIAVVFEHVDDDPLTLRPNNRIRST